MTHRQFIELLLSEFGVYKPEYTETVAKMPNERHRAFYLKWVEDLEVIHVRIALDYEDFGEFHASMSVAFNDFTEIDWIIDTVA